MRRLKSGVMMVARRARVSCCKHYEVTNAMRHPRGAAIAPPEVNLGLNLASR